MNNTKVLQLWSKDGEAFDAKTKEEFLIYVDGVLQDTKGKFVYIVIEKKSVE